MSVIKSLSVGDGDLFYIDHNSPNFTVIDCCLNDDRADEILEELTSKIDAVYQRDGIYRFISTHPDEDHFRGIELLDEKKRIVNFYCVENSAKKSAETPSFKKYKELRDGDGHYYLKQHCKRKWMNQSGDGRSCAGINVLWPDVDNPLFKEALIKANDADASPNNISPIIKYSVENGVVALWMGDLERSFTETIKGEICLPEVDIFFAPHHGRDSGKPPKEWLDAMNPTVIVIGEAESDFLNYYPGWNTITQNTAGDIEFVCSGSTVDVYVSREDYSVDYLDDRHLDREGMNYIGSFECKSVQ